MRHVYPNHEIPHLWVHQSQDEARNSTGSFYFEGPTIYSYGSHFPIARYVTNERGERAILFTTAHHSVTTSGPLLGCGTRNPPGRPRLPRSSPAEEPGRPADPHRQRRELCSAYFGTARQGETRSRKS